MSLDGFSPGQEDAFVGFSHETARRYFASVALVSRWLDIRVLGLSRIPSGRGLLVANHAFGWDMAFPMAAIARRLGRTVWVLGEHAWWKVPFLRTLASRVGVVDGTRENVDRLLSGDELVLVLPGGLREAVKPRELRYHLLWGERYGFVRAAIRNQAPLIPLASIGTDELFDFVGNAYARGERWLGRPGIPIPLPARVLPIPHRVQVRFLVGEPIYPRASPEQAGEADAQRSLRREVEGALHELIEEELARRAGL